MTDTFCPLPWNFQAIQNNGTVRVCCQMNMTAGRGTLFKQDGTPYNAKSDNLSDARNATLIKDVRQHMLEGKWHPDCKRCQQEEEAGLNSRRKYEKTNWPNYTVDYAKQHTESNGEINTDLLPVLYYDLRFGNVCNLACRMCGPEDSHSWYKDWAKMYGTEWNDTHGKVRLEKNNKGRWVTNAYDWHYSEDFWSQLENNLHNINHVYMAGGEPLIIDRHYEFLNKCIERGISENITLEYNTNLTTLPEKAITLWNNFKKVRIGASVDGFGKVLEYQRHPAKWKQIEKNIKHLDSLPSNIEAWLACTVTNLNVYHIPEFMLWKLNQNFEKINIYTTDTIITHHVCHKPWYSSIRVLPLSIKEDIKQHYENQRELFSSYNTSVQKRAFKIMDSIITYMMAKDESDKLHLFTDYTTKLDIIRQQKVIDIVPQYKDLFTDDYYKK